MGGLDAQHAGGAIGLEVHAGDEPVVLTEFSYGPLETLAMTVGSWLLPRNRQ